MKIRCGNAAVSCLLASLLFAGVGCEGPTGPQGPPGPQGGVGPDGPAGPSGEDGQDGNANVVVVSLDGGDVTWAEGTYRGRPANVFVFSTDAVTQDIIDHGTVLGYFLLGSAWYPMPFAWENTAGTDRQYITFSYMLETITLYAYRTSGLLTPAPTEYRLLLITDHTVTGATAGDQVVSQLEGADVDVASYSEVMTHFGLPN